MADSPRIDDLRRRVQKDPSSIAFAQLAEELRRAGRCEEAVEVCHAGLATHPAYLSARVTLGRALIELNQLDDALVQLERVLKSAPENLAARRGVAEIYHRRGDLAPALQQYRDALALAKNDPDLQQTVADLSKQVEPQKPKHVDEGLTLEQMQDELFKVVPPPPRPVPHEPEPVPAPQTAPVTEAPAEAVDPVAKLVESLPLQARPPAPPREPSVEQAQSTSNGRAAPIAERIEPVAERIGPAAEPSEPAGEPVVPVNARAGAAAESGGPDARDREGSAGTVESVLTADHARAQQTIATLERWLDAIHASRTQRGA